MVTMMDLNKYLIELDEYLDLTELESINEEFKKESTEEEKIE